MASWTHDGTQDPGPPPLLNDPLSGLVTGRHYDAESVRVRVVEPSMPDITAVREAMASVLDEDSELMFGDRAFAEPTPPPAAPAAAAAAPPAAAPPAAAAAVPAAPVADPKTSELPVQVQAPPAPPVALPPVVESGPRSRVPARFDAGRPGMLPGRIPMQRSNRPPRPARARRRGWSPGMAAIGLLLLVMAVLAIVMLANLIDMIASLFS